MLLVAQRVVSTSGKAGTNAFVYRHGNYTGAEPPDPDDFEGILVGSIVELPPGGNNVSSYLDVVVPDEWSIERIDHLVEEVRSTSTMRLPCRIVRGPALVRFGLSERLASIWRGELRALYQAARRAGLDSGEVRHA